MLVFVCGYIGLGGGRKEDGQYLFGFGVGICYSPPSSKLIKSIPYLVVCLAQKRRNNKGGWGEKE